MRGVDHLGFCGSPILSKSPKQIFPDPALGPASKPIIDGGWRTIFGRAIAPAATALQHMHDAANDAPIIRSLNTSYICRQMGLNPIPLLVAQPKEIRPHDPGSPKRIRSLWNHDPPAIAAKLMSLDPSRLIQSD
jgi:hypothetical protein